MFDLPYGTYNTPKEAVATTVRVVQETGIQLVKLEGYLPDVVRVRFLRNTEGASTAVDLSKVATQRFQRHAQPVYESNPVLLAV